MLSPRKPDGVTAAPPEHDAVAAARELFERLAHAAPLLGEDATAAIDTKRTYAETILSRPNLGLVVVGHDPEARAHLVNRLLGAELIDPERGDAGGARVQFRRGAQLQYRARLRDGRTEEFIRMVPDRAAELGGGLVGLQAGLNDLRAALVLADDARQPASLAFADAQRALSTAERDVPPAGAAVEQADAELRRVEAAHAELAGTLAERQALVPAALVTRPPWWAIWAWLQRLVVARRHRGPALEVAALRERLVALEARRVEVAALTLSARAALNDLERRRDALEQAHAIAASAFTAADRRRESIAVEIAELEHDLGRVTDEGLAHQEARRTRFELAVRELTDANARAGEVEELIVELPELPEGVVVFEVATRGNVLEMQRGWLIAARDGDGCVLAGEGELPREAKAIFGRAMRLPGAPGAAALRACVARARLLRVTRLAEEATQIAAAALDEARARAGEALERRLERIEAQRIPEADAFASARLDTLAPAFAERVRVLLQTTAEAHEQELLRVADRWSAELRAATTLAELRTAAARLEAGSAAALAEAGAVAYARFTAALTAAAFELAGQLVIPLGDDATRALRAPQLPPAAPFREIQPVRLANVGSWLARVRKLARVKDDCERALVDAREKVRREVGAELLASEPGVRDVLRAAARDAAAGAIAARERALDEQVARTRAEASRDPANDADRALRAELEARVQRLRRAQDALGTS